MAKLSLSEISQRFNVSRSTLYRSIKEGRLSRSSDGLFDLTEVMKANTYDAKVNNNINVATDFGEKITENAVKETTAEMHKNKIPSDSKDECFDYENM